MKFVEVNGIKLSQLMIGTGDIKKWGSTEMLDQFVAAGGTAIDTAHQYREAEKIVGQWLRETGNRDRVVILTKGAHHDDGSPGARVTPEAIRKDLSESLERLGTDRIDLYALHRDDPSVPVGPVIEELNRHLEAGTVRAIGASNWTYLRIKEANEYAASHGLKGFMFNSVNLSLARRTSRAGRAAYRRTRRPATGIRRISCRCCRGRRRRADFSPDCSHLRTVPMRRWSECITTKTIGSDIAERLSWLR